MRIRAEFISKRNIGPNYILLYILLFMVHLFEKMSMDRAPPSPNLIIQLKTLAVVHASNVHASMSSSRAAA